MRSALRRLTAIAALLTIAISARAADQKWVRELARGVTLTQIVRTCEKGAKQCAPQFINILTVDPKTPGVEVKTILAQDRVWGDDPTKGRETVSSMVKRTGAIAAVNGDFANWCGDPDNLFILDGELVSDPWTRRPVLAIKEDQTYLFDKVIWENQVTTERGDTYPLAGMNKVAEWDELILFTPRFFTTTLSKGNRRQEVVIETNDLPVRPGVPIKGRVVSFNEDGNTPIKPGTVVLSGTVHSGQFVRSKLTPGTAVTITTDLKPKETTGWDKVKYTVGGCPWIVRDGKFWMDAEEEHVVPAFYDVPNPRTAVGKTKDGKLVIVTVDGRQAIAVGMKLSELAEVMISHGCVEAINLDGGGSTQMSTPFGVLNSPSDGRERESPTALAVYGTTRLQCLASPELAVAGLPAEMKSGDTARLRLTDSKGRPLPKELAEKVVWSTNGTIGVVDQSGKFYASKAHEGEVRAWLGGKFAAAKVKVLPGETNRIALFFQQPAEDKSNVEKLAIYTRDLNANPMRFQKLKITVTGGTADQTEITTNDDGAAWVTITWTSDYTGPQQVEVRCGDIVSTAPRPAHKS